MCIICIYYSILVIASVLNNDISEGERGEREREGGGGGGGGDRMFLNLRLITRSDRILGHRQHQNKYGMESHFHFWWFGGRSVIQSRTSV